MAQKKALIAQLRQEAGPQEFYVDKGLVLPMPTLAQVRAWSEEKDPDARLRLLMGDDWDRVVEYWDEYPIRFWHDFIRLYHNFVFGRGADEVEGK